MPQGLVNRVNAASPRSIDIGAACLLALLLLTQCPGAGWIYGSAQQYVELERVERIDDRCRKYHIDAATARQALPRFDLTGMGGEIDGRALSGWDLLRGSDTPKPVTIDKARRLLTGD
jgi:hypothetical protein